MQMGFNKADTAYFVETRMLEANNLSLADLRSVLRARRLARKAAADAAATRKTPIIAAAGQNRTHTMFRLQVNLVN
jgi:hypothetical protein